MNRIQIRSENASLEITSRRAQLYIESPRPEMKVVSRPNARMVVHRSAPRLRVNWDKVRSAPQNQYRHRINTRPQVGDGFTELDAIDFVGYDLQDTTGMDATQTAIRGARLARTRTSVMRKAAMQSGQPYPIQARAASIASALEWELGSVDIEWEIEQGRVEWSISRPRVEVEPYSVEIRMHKYPKLYITYNPNNIVRVTGRKLDKRI